MALEFLHELKGIGPMGETVTVTEYWPGALTVMSRVMAPFDHE